MAAATERPSDVSATILSQWPRPEVSIERPRFNHTDPTVAKDQNRSLLRLKDRNSVLIADNQALRLVGNALKGVCRSAGHPFLRRVFTTLFRTKVENPESTFPWP